MRRIIINDRTNIDGLGVFALAHLPEDHMSRALCSFLGTRQTCLGKKGGGRDTDDMAHGMNAIVVVETDENILGFGTLLK